MAEADPRAALAAVSEVDCDPAGDSDGVGSNGTQPIPLNQTSTHEWASKSRTAYSFVAGSSAPGAKPVATRAGMPSIRSINAIAPGMTVTDMTEDLAESEEGKRRLRDMPLGRFGRADEVADAVIFLLSDASSLFLGQTLNPNGGGYMP